MKCATCSLFTQTIIIMGIVNYSCVCWILCVFFSFYFSNTHTTHTQSKMNLSSEEWGHQGTYRTNWRNIRLIEYSANRSSVTLHTQTLVRARVMKPVMSHSRWQPVVWVRWFSLFAVGLAIARPACAVCVHSAPPIFSFHLLRSRLSLRTRIMVMNKFWTENVTEKFRIFHLNFGRSPTLFLDSWSCVCSTAHRIRKSSTRNFFVGFCLFVWIWS